MLTVCAYSNVATYENYAEETVPLPDAGIPGELATFSSVGPTFDGRQKPDIVAPGHGVISSLATNLREAFLGLEVSPVTAGGYHAIFSGTSMAAPVVTGSVALYLEKNPTATSEQVKNAITGAARTDDQTDDFGALPNAHWGHGKLDIYRAIYGTTSGVEDESGRSGLALGRPAPNPVTTTTSLAFTLDTRRVVRLELVDMSGAVRETLIDGPVDAGRHEIALDATALEPGAYTVRLSSAEAAATTVMTVLR